MKIQDWNAPPLCEGEKSSRRVWKTHAPAHQVPWKGGAFPFSSKALGTGLRPGAKIIVVTRNPKDVAVSLFNHSKDVNAFNYGAGTWPHFLATLFAAGQVESGDFW